MELKKPFRYQSEGLFCLLGLVSHIITAGIYLISVCFFRKIDLKEIIIIKKALLLSIRRALVV
jgi:hypothetical protein